MDSTAPGPGALELDPAERKALRAEAHHLDPVVVVGDAGLTEAVLAETDRALNAHGLIKIRVRGDDRESRLQMLEEICTRLGCAPVQAIGKLLVVWRPKPETGTGGNAGTARRRAARQTKKAAGAGQKATGGRAARPAGKPAAGTSAGSQRAAATKVGSRVGGAGASQRPVSGDRPARPGAAGARPAKASPAPRRSSAGGFAKPGSAFTTRTAANPKGSPAGSTAGVPKRAPASGPMSGPMSGAKRPGVGAAGGAAKRPSAGFASPGRRTAAPAAGPSRGAARPATRSARPGSGTRGRRRAP